MKKYTAPAHTDKSRAHGIDEQGILIWQDADGFSYDVVAVTDSALLRPCFTSKYPSTMPFAKNDYAPQVELPTQEDEPLEAEEFNDLMQQSLLSDRVVALASVLILAVLSAVVAVAVWWQGRS